MTRRTLLPVALAAAATISAGAFYSRRPEPAAALTTGPVSRGSIVTVVSATGTVQPVTSVEVGTQALRIAGGTGEQETFCIRAGSEDPAYNRRRLHPT